MQFPSAAEVLNLQDHFARRGSPWRIGVREISTHHPADDHILGHVLNVICGHQFAVPENRDSISDFKDLVQVVGNIDDGDAGSLQIPDHCKEAVYLSGG
jgi:hypothetical protein